MAYTETKTVGYGSRVGSSFRGIGTGFMLFLAGTALLWWNEGRVVKTDKMLNEAEGKTEQLESIDRIDPEMEGVLICASGLATTDDSLQDSQFGVGARAAIQLKRTVEYYQYVEESHKETKDKLGGKQETTTTYTYKEAWVGTPVESSRFHDPAYQQKNYVLCSAESQQWQAEKVTFGAFELNERQIASISGDQPVELQMDSARIEKWQQDVRQTLRLRFGGQTDSIRAVHVDRDELYFGINPGSPNIGDVRITWTMVPPAKVTIIARQKGNTFTSFKAKNGKTFSTLVMGVRDADEIYEGAHSSNHTMMWILRLVGILMVIGGLKGVFAFIETLLKVVPFVANIIGWGVGVVCTVVGIAWSLVVIALAWLFYRPLVAIGLLALAGFLVWLFAFKGKDKLKELAARAKQQPQTAVETNKQ